VERQLEHLAQGSGVHAVQLQVLEFVEIALSFPNSYLLVLGERWGEKHCRYHFSKVGVARIVSETMGKGSLGHQHVVDGTGSHGFG